MKQLLFIILIIGLLLTSCKPITYTSISPPLEKQPNSDNQMICGIENIQQKTNIKYIKIEEGL